MPVTKIRSRWDSGNLIFHESTSLASSANILTIATTGVSIGNASNESITKGLAIRGGSNCATGIEIRDGSGRLFHANPSGPATIAYAFHANIPANITMTSVFYCNNYSDNLESVIKLSDHASGGGLDNFMYMHEGTLTYLIHVNSPVTGITALLRDNSGDTTYVFDFKSEPANVSAVCQTNTVDSDGAIKMRISGVTYFIPIFNVAHTTGSW